MVFNHSSNQPFKQSTIQAINHSSKQSFNHSIIQSFKQSSKQSFNHSIIQSFYHSIIQSFYHSIIQSFYHSIILSFYHSIIQSIIQATLSCFYNYFYHFYKRSLKNPLLFIVFSFINHIIPPFLSLFINPHRNLFKKFDSISPIFKSVGLTELNSKEK
ncbi:hypothetical protein [Helicobacter pylori]|uniref:hypothetical protein n=1 Tax=Helicobacter pylori TaxID=210 RepID=UPI003F8EE5CE